MLHNNMHFHRVNFHLFQFPSFKLHKFLQNLMIMFSNKLEYLELKWKNISLSVQSVT